jgi:hypothetical protein
MMLSLHALSGFDMYAGFNAVRPPPSGKRILHRTRKRKHERLWKHKRNRYNMARTIFSDSFMFFYR